MRSTCALADLGKLIFGVARVYRINREEGTSMCTKSLNPRSLPIGFIVVPL